MYSLLKLSKPSTDTELDSAADPQTNPVVFLSYSRTDDAFADALVNALEAGGTDVSLDRRDIADAEAWWAKLQSLIEEADAFAFVISPRSVTSPECHREIEHAALLG